MDIYHCSAGLVVTGRIRDIGQNVLQSSFQTGSSSSPTYFLIFFLIAFLGEEFIRNVIIILCINYTRVIIGINDNNIVITNYGRLQYRILLFKIYTGTRKNFFDIFTKFRHSLYSSPPPGITWLDKENEMD
jgi:hypothetical protein